MNDSTNRQQKVVLEYPQEVQEALAKARDLTGMKLGDFHNETKILTESAKKLAEERIKGQRKDLPDEQNYSHSFRVYETVRNLHHWDDPDEEMFIAALLHDIVEDGDTSLLELAELGFTKNIIELIYLCSHDDNIENKTERWALMVSKLIVAKSEEAWAIKLIDLSDNLKQSHGLTDENRKFMVEVKAPMFLRLTEPYGSHIGRYINHLKETLSTLGN